MKNEIKEKTATSPAKVVILSVVGVTLTVLLGFAIYFGLKLYKNKDNIGFAIEKPNIVKSIREQYNKKQQEVDNSFLKTQQTAEDRLLEAITKEIKK